MNDERGAVAVMVAVLFTALLGSAALVIDVGALRVEEAELQNGADAAVIALAKACADNPSQAPCTTPAATAAALVNGNAGDGVALVEQATIDTTARTVRVVAATERPGGARSLTNTFGRLLGRPTSVVRVDATASWTPEVGVLAVSWFPIAACALPPAESTTTVALALRGGSCSSVPDGSNANGQSTDSKCNPNTDCDDWMEWAEQYLPLEVLLPVFTKSGSSWTYQGYASFSVTGWKFNGGRSRTTTCTHDSCISGVFTARSRPGGTQPTRCSGSFFGLSVCTFPGSIGLRS